MPNVARNSNPDSRLVLGDFADGEACGAATTILRHRIRSSFRLLVRGLGGLILLAGWTASAAPLGSANLPPAPLALPDASFSVIRVFGALVFVLALFLAGVWLFKNWQRFARGRGGSAHLQVLEMRALGTKHVLYVVGYQQQRLLVATSPNGVSLLTHLPAAENAPLEPVQPASPHFIQILQQAVQGKS